MFAVILPGCKLARLSMFNRGVPRLRRMPGRFSDAASSRIPAARATSAAKAGTPPHRRRARPARLRKDHGQDEDLAAASSGINPDAVSHAGAGPRRHCGRKSPDRFDAGAVGSRGGVRCAPGDVIRPCVPTVVSGVAGGAGSESRPYTPIPASTTIASSPAISAVRRWQRTSEVKGSLMPDGCAATKAVPSRTWWKGAQVPMVRGW